MSVKTKRVVISGYEVEIEYEYLPPEDWGGVSYRVPGDIKLKSFIVTDRRIPKGEGWMLFAHQILGSKIEECLDDILDSM